MAIIKLVHKIWQRNAPDYQCEQTRYVGDLQRCALRKVGNFRKQQRSLFYEDLKFFNSHPNSIKNEWNINWNIFRKLCILIIKK